MATSTDELLLGVKSESNLDISCSQWKYYSLTIVLKVYILLLIIRYVSPRIKLRLNQVLHLEPIQVQIPLHLHCYSLLNILLTDHQSQRYRRYNANAGRSKLILFFDNHVVTLRWSTIRQVRWHVLLYRYKAAVDSWFRIIKLKIYCCYYQLIKNSHNHWSDEYIYL